jgi:hypothetical protein
MAVLRIILKDINIMRAQSAESCDVNRSGDDCT